jgi:hypothetical protein
MPLVLSIKNQQGVEAQNTVYQYTRILSVVRYWELCLSLGYGKKKQAAEEVAKIIWGKSPGHGLEYKRRCIQTWANSALRLGQVPTHNQGKHIKRITLLMDNDISAKAQQYLRTLPPKERSPLQLKKCLQDVILPSTIGFPGTISSRTCLAYMHKWGYQFRRQGQNIYFDGHEREDVLIYRKNWAQRMMNYRALMRDYDGNGLSVYPNLQGNEKEHIWVTHDETYFYANDNKVFLSLNGFYLY